MTNERRKGVADRRTGNERRMYRENIGFPFIDSHGQLVTEERRNYSDRRRATGSRQFDDERGQLSEKLKQQTA